LKKNNNYFQKGSFNKNKIEFNELKIPVLHTEGSEKLKILNLDEKQSLNTSMNQYK